MIQNKQDKNSLLLIEEVKGGLKKALDSNIDPSEEIKVCLNGDPGECLVVTDKRVMIIKAGYSSGAMFGQKVKSYPFNQITSVEYSCGLISGRIQITVPGSVEQTQRRNENIFSASFDARQAENVVNFGSAKKEQFKQAAAIIRQMCNSSNNQSATKTEPDIIEQIKKLAELKEAGILTEEEFNTKKAELLQRL